MAEYVVLLPGDENVWETTSPEDQEHVFEVHRRFAALLDERGHQVTGGAHLAHSRASRTIRTRPSGDQTVTQGPYAETVEQLTGFYVIESDDLDDLVEVTKTLGRGESVIEIRPAMGAGS